MANSGQLAGLAALGALGIMYDRMNRNKNAAPVEDRSNAATPVDSGAFYEAGSGPTGPALASNTGAIDDESQWGTPVPGQVAYRKPVRRPTTQTARPTAQTSQAPSMPSYGSRYPTQAQRLTTANDPRVNPNFDPTSAQGAGPSSYPTQGTRPSTGNMVRGQGARYDSNGIPIGGITAPQGGERVDNPSEFRRMMEAAGPARLAGIGNMATEALTAGRVQRAYNAQQAARRAAEGLSPAEAAAAKARLAEAAFEGGMKKGGKVKPKVKAKAKPKKMASGGMTSRPNASKRADGIATKGHTKCKMR